MDRFSSFIDELRRRRVVRAAVTYLIVAWLLVQVAATTFPLLDFPDWAARAVLVVLLLGFPVAMVLAWAFDFSRPLQATAETAPDESARRRYGSLPLITIVAVLVGSGVGAFFALGGLHPARAPGKSIAVLPFENLSGRAEDAYLADGLQEEILNALARLRDLKVISRTSVMEYRGQAHNVREIGRRLEVATVLEGSVRREGEKLRLTVQLVDARDDNHLLAANYDRDLGHVLDLQSTVAKLVADALAATLSAHERGELDRVATNSGDAYDRYLRALAAYRQPVEGDDDGLAAPARLLEEALGFDPDYADALALLSRVHTWSWFIVTQHDDDAAAARAAFERALVIDPELPEARLARGLHAMYVARDLDRALDDFSAVVAQRPNDAEAHHLLGLSLRRKGRFDDALEHLSRARDLDPLNRPYSNAPITTLVGLRRLPEAIALTELCMQRFPNDVQCYFVRARLQGRLQHDLEPLRAALREHGSQLGADARRAVEAEIAEGEGRYLDAVKLWSEVPVEDPMARGLRIGSLYALAGDAEQAQRSYSAAESAARDMMQHKVPVVLRMLAIAQSLQGDHTAALATIEEARATQGSEASDAINGPEVSFMRSMILVRAGRTEEGHAEATRLLQVPFGAPRGDFFGPEEGFLRVAVRGDPFFDRLFDDPPRL